MTSQTEIRVLEISPPESLDSPEAELFHGGVDVEFAIAKQERGYTDLCPSAEEVLVSLRSQKYYKKIRLAAVAGLAGAPRREDVLGWASIDLPRHDNLHLAEVHVAVRPECRGRGVGTALYSAAEELARDAGRTTILAWSDHRDAPSTRGDDDSGLEAEAILRPPTGIGGVPPDDAPTRFAVRNGFQLEQVGRHSVLPAPIDSEHNSALLSAAEQRANVPETYQLVTWKNRCPDEWLEQFAKLRQKMSTDAPMAGLEIEEEDWDGARIRDEEDRTLAFGRTSYVTAALHVQSGLLAAFTAIETVARSTEFAFQGDTLVIKGHRGNKLGQLVKAVNLARVLTENPGLKRIHTWNAAGNSYMLRVNLDQGYRPEDVEGEWQKRLQESG
ncbi:GNAT family N-acetyltransferase [Saxibacter everestensis]|uniref:GNAT family N-acetyltransferase n=1 Tax=Saxibacter everestensis TaxID=2909229 RepID=A0ABY8QPN4_9MICO|nr:GNAT family N-acetyltransferase [Brevibacteriaceae bacterium ZFBP1038]